jgi:hypothetical protein
MFEGFWLRAHTKRKKKAKRGGFPSLSLSLFFFLSGQARVLVRIPVCVCGRVFVSQQRQQHGREPAATFFFFFFSLEVLLLFHLFAQAAVFLC